MLSAYETVLCLSAVPLGAIDNTTVRMARLQPYIRRRAKPLQLTSGLDFLSIQAYRLWMEYPSRFLDESDQSTQHARILRSDPAAASAAGVGVPLPSCPGAGRRLQLAAQTGSQTIAPGGRRVARMSLPRAEERDGGHARLPFRARRITRQSDSLSQ